MLTGLPIAGGKSKGRGMLKVDSETSDMGHFLDSRKMLCDFSIARVLPDLAIVDFFIKPWVGMPMARSRAD
jgi:hypothetical protein